MSLLKPPYLRIETPQTTDGINLKYRDGQIVSKETHVPVTALKQFEKENMGRPEHLKHKITRVSEDDFKASQVIKQPVAKQPEADDAPFTVTITEKKIQPVKKKRGRQPKAIEQ